MADRNERWVEVSKSTFAHETAGLDLIRQLLPVATPYRAWTNFEFMDNHGQWHEIDALVLGRRRLHLVELKAYTGVLQGTETSWVRTTMGGRTQTQRSPLLLTRRKAQRLATRIQEEARKVALGAGLDPEKVRRALPFVQESVFLHGSPFATDLPDLAKSSLFGIDGEEQKTGLPGISDRLLEAPTNGRIVDEDISVIIALALKNLGITRRAEREAGSWIIAGEALATGEDWQERAATHRGTDEHGRARIVSLRPGTPAHAKSAAHRRMAREYTLLSSLRHEYIVAPRDLVQDDDGNTVLIYPETPGYVSLDLLVATQALSAEQQVAILRQVADALAYAHRNHVAHRGLEPSAVLINADALAEGAVRVQLADWSWAGRVHTGGTESTTMLGTAMATPGTSADQVYLAPEDRWAPDADRLALDLFSLGALAYFLFTSGQPPARDRAGLLERLRQDQGLDLAASGGRFVDETLRQLVLQSTSPSVSKRLKTDKAGKNEFGVSEFANALAQYEHERRGSAEVAEADPLNPAPGALLSGRFQVEKILGTGSTARGVLVSDQDHDDRLSVLKIGLDESATPRLREEAKVLEELARLSKPVPGVVQLIEGPLELAAGRSALLLTNCGEQTLADVVRHTPLAESQLRTWGMELLDAVVALDEAGITHRDIKPSNLGLMRPQGKSRGRTRLALFDFSLSRAPVEQVDAGTPPYRDPFLGTGLRRTYDSSAERYSAGVVLFEMATATTPSYGDGVSNPGVLADDVSIAVEDFTAAGLARTRSESLAEFFRSALARNVKDRFDTATAMRQAWAAAFKAAPAGGDEQTKPPVQQPVVAVFDETEPYGSLSVLASEFARAAGGKPSVVRRQVVEMVLGTHPQSPEDPFVVYQRLAEAAEVTPGRIAQIFGEFSALWAKNARLAASVRDLYARGLALIESSGGASTPDQLARELAGVLAADGVVNPHRAALGVVRLLLASAAATGGVSAELQIVRRHGSGRVAMISTPQVSRKLPAALADQAERLADDARAQGAMLVAPAAVESPLRETAATVLGVAPADVEIPGHVLLRIAASASTEVALSARDELYRRDLTIEDALRILLRGMADTDSFSRTELESRLAARFPALTKKLPRRPDLDTLVESIQPDIRWSEDASRYQFPGTPDSASYIPTRHSVHAPSGPRVAGVSDAEQILADSVRDRTFRALGVPLGRSDEVAAALVERFGATHIDVTELLLGELRERAAGAGIPWDQILAADAGAAGDRENLKSFVTQAVSTVTDAVSAAGGPVVLSDLSTLAAYGQLHVLGAWTDLTKPPAHAVWALVPQRAESGGLSGPRVDDSRLPINSPEQFVQLDKIEVDALLAMGQSAKPKTKESV
ncbi:protein kinase domain-containing protein [Dietzia cercidiphylli]|uniref:protein kinase domain-containing protein n=1 Tax=Dietzia cercidiphylli TaxID=498199 RepID=UPI003F7EDCC2